MQEIAGSASSWLVAQTYLGKIRSLEKTIRAKEKAVQQCRASLDIRGYSFDTKTTGGSGRGLEDHILEVVERIEQLTADIERAREELADEIKPFHRLPRDDQAVLRDRYIDKHKKRSFGYSSEFGRNTIDQFMASYQALERLYDSLPERWKDSIPKAI